MTRQTIALAICTLTMAAQSVNAQTNGQSDETAKSASQPVKGKVASEAAPRPLAVKAAGAGEPRAASTNAISEILAQNIKVDPGKSVRIVAKSDFGGAERASFGVYAEASVNITKLRIAIWWGIADSSAYSVHDLIAGSSFFYTNTGAGTVSVGGPSLLVDVINEGDTAFTIQQLTVYAVTR